MRLDEASLREFVKIWQVEFGEALSLDEARNQASRLLELYALLYRPAPGENKVHQTGLAASPP